MAFGYFVSAPFTGAVSRPAVAVEVPPVPVLVVVALLVTVRVLLFTSINSSDFLAHVSRIGVKTFTTGPVLALPVKLLVSVQV